jgi:single-strand DNA-binding protein
MLNKQMVIGRLGKDPESRFFQDGTACCNFSVATTETWKDKQTGEKKEHTEWINVSAVGRLAEICGQYLKKGSLVYCEGKQTTRKWQDKDGNDRYTTELKLREMKMLGGGREANQNAGQQQNSDPFADAPAFPANVPQDDDIPF